jgi:FdhD protein
VPVPEVVIATRIVTRPVESAPGEGPHDDAIAVEEPLEIRIAGEPVAVTMRTPGEDGELALGFLYAEGIIEGPADVGTVAHCGRPGSEGFGNVIDVTPGAGTTLVWERVEATRRGTITTSACGVCGRRSIDDLLAVQSTLPPGAGVSREALRGAIEGMRSAQSLFARTGGTHAAAAHRADGQRLLSREDVGRHNAVDKVIGALLKENLVGARAAPGGGAPAILAVSGRASFEIVQKAARARIPVVASVSAPTSLAIDLAERAGVTLAGFVRGERVNVYAHGGRLLP